MFTISRASERDEKAVKYCIDSAYMHYVELLGKRPAPMLEDHLDQIRNNEVYVAIGQSDDDTQPIGAVAGVLVLVISGERIRLDNVAVSPFAQGHGLGKQLIKFAEARATALGFNEIALYTHEKMRENQAMYVHLGYAETGRIQEKGYSRIYFAKSLT